jgi:hypothetical protein
MGIYGNWIHGTALAVQNPENVTRVGYFGWGADMLIAAGKGSWFHIAIPTPVVISGVQSKLDRAFLLFNSISGSIRNVHIYDGPRKLLELNELFLTGDHQNSVDGTNMFELEDVPHVFLGIGISFFFLADVPTGGPFGGAPPPQLVVTGAGADFINLHVG